MLNRLEFRLEDNWAVKVRYGRDVNIFTGSFKRWGKPRGCRCFALQDKTSWFREWKALKRLSDEMTVMTWPPLAIQHLEFFFFCQFPNEDQLFKRTKSQKDGITKKNNSNSSTITSTAFFSCYFRNNCKRWAILFGCCGLHHPWDLLKTPSATSVISTIRNTGTATALLRNGYGIAKVRTHITTVPYLRAVPPFFTRYRLDKV